MSQNLSEIRGRIVELRRIERTDDEIAKELGITKLLIEKVFDGSSTVKMGSVEKSEALRLFKEGYTIRRTAQLLGRGQISVSQALKEHIEKRPKKFRVFVENEQEILSMLGNTHLVAIAEKYKSSYANLRLWLISLNRFRNKSSKRLALQNNVISHLRSGVSLSDIKDAGGPTISNLLTFAYAEGTKQDVAFLEGLRTRTKAPKRRWSSEEVDTLIDMKCKGKSIAEIAKKLGRSKAAVNIKQHQV